MKAAKPLRPARPEVRGSHELLSPLGSGPPLGFLNSVEGAGFQEFCGDRVER